MHDLVTEWQRLLPIGFEIVPQPSAADGNGRYSIVRKVGKGGQGTVYEAFDRILNATTALKFARYKDENTQAYLLAEAKRVASVSGHPNVVVARDFGNCYAANDAALFYIAFEWLGEGDMRTFAPSDIKDVLRVAVDACRGVAYLHKMRIAHRDIKPANLLRAPDGYTKVADLGLATDSNLAASDPFQHWGTPGYMAPEQMSMGLSLHDEDEAKRGAWMKVDVFQMGVTIFELLEGKRPFSMHNDPNELRAEIRAQRPRFTRFRVPRAVDDLLVQMLDADPARRPESMDRVATALSHALAEREYALHRSSDLIRRAIKEKIVDVFDLFTQRKSPLTPLAGERQDWYATILLRPAKKEGEYRRQSLTPLADHFYPIYLPHMRGRDSSGRAIIRHHHDWIMDEASDYAPLPISSCCSGLLIRWYAEGEEWRRSGYYDRRFFEVFSDSQNRIKYAVCRDLRTALARSHPKNAQIIYDHYATDYPEKEDAHRAGRHLNWQMYAVDNPDAEPHTFSREMQTEIMVPIYEPCMPDDYLGAENIIGVANFEWVERLSDEREQAIGNQLHTWIHINGLFPLSSFLAEIVEIVLPTYVHPSVK